MPDLHFTPPTMKSPTVSHALVAAPAPLGVGGLGTAAAEFSMGLDHLGIDWHYVGLQPSSKLAGVLTGRPFRRVFGMSPARRVTARSVRRVVLASQWELCYSIPGSVPIERDHGVKAIYQATRHPATELAALQRGEEETGGKGDMSPAECRRRERELREADVIHVTSLAVRDELIDAGIPTKRLVHSYHGVDLERSAPGEKRANLTIAFIGPLSLRKGVDMAAEVASRLAGGAVVEAVGGPTCPWSRRIAESANFVPRSSASETLATAHALILPSRSDGFSFVVLEALASGTIPIVTPEVGASEIVRRLDDRLVVDRTIFADRTLELLDELDFADLAPQARTLAEEFDRRQTSRAAAIAVLKRAEEFRSG